MVGDGVGSRDEVHRVGGRDAGQDLRAEPRGRIGLGWRVGGVGGVRGVRGWGGGWGGWGASASGSGMGRYGEIASASVAVSVGVRQSGFVRVRQGSSGFVRVEAGVSSGFVRVRQG